MTGADFTGVDIDLLADYLGGALDGTPEAARVAALIIDDPAWRDAHALLSVGMADVGDALHSWGAVPEPMPADVVARLDAALGEPAEAAPAPGRHLSAVPETDVDRQTARRPRSWRRTLRWGSPVAAAAAVLGLMGVGLSYLNIGDSTSSSDSAATSAGSGLAAQAAPEAAGVPGIAKITSTGIDYGPDTIAGETSEPFRAPDASKAAPRSSRQGAAPSSGGVSDQSLTDPLARLRPQGALQSCLDAIAAENGGGQITVQTVDYARYSGNPALIVHFTAGNGAWAWASGPGCGLSGMGPNTLYSVKVG